METLKICLLRHRKTIRVRKGFGWNDRWRVCVIISFLTFYKMELKSVRSSGRLCHYFKSTATKVLPLFWTRLLNFTFLADYKKEVFRHLQKNVHNLKYSKIYLYIFCSLTRKRDSSNLPWMCGEEPVSTWASRHAQKEAAASMWATGLKFTAPEGGARILHAARAQSVRRPKTFASSALHWEFWQTIHSLSIYKLPCETRLDHRLSHDARPSGLCAPLNKPATGCRPKYRRSKALVSLMLPKTVVALM